MDYDIFYIGTEEAEKNWEAASSDPWEPGWYWATGFHGFNGPFQSKKLAEENVDRLLTIF